MTFFGFSFFTVESVIKYEETDNGREYYVNAGF